MTFATSEAARDISLWQVVLGNQNTWMSTADGGIIQDDVSFSLENVSGSSGKRFSRLEFEKTGGCSTRQTRRG